MNAYFALVVMAQIKAKRIKKGDVCKAAKIALIRILYERGDDREQIVRLCTVIDLPKGLEQNVLQTIYAIEEHKRMLLQNEWIGKRGLSKASKLNTDESVLN